MYFGKVFVLCLLAVCISINVASAKRRPVKSVIKKTNLPKIAATCACQKPLLDIVNCGCRGPIETAFAALAPLEIAISPCQTPVIDIPNYRYAEPIELSPLGALFPTLDVPIIEYIDLPCGCPASKCNCRAPAVKIPCQKEIVTAIEVPSCQGVQVPGFPYPYSAPVIELPSYPAPAYIPGRSQAYVVSPCDCQGPCSCPNVLPLPCGCQGTCSCPNLPMSSCGCQGSCACSGMPVNACACPGPCTCSSAPTYQAISVPSCGCVGPCSCSDYPIAISASPCACQGTCSCPVVASSACGCAGPCSCADYPMSLCGCQGACSCSPVANSPCGCQGMCSCPTIPASTCSCPGPCACPALAMSPCSCQGPCSCADYQVVPASCPGTYAAMPTPCTCQGECACPAMTMPGILPALEAPCGCGCGIPGCNCGKYLRQVTIQPPFL